MKKLHKLRVIINLLSKTNGDCIRVSRPGLMTYLFIGLFCIGISTVHANVEPLKNIEVNVMDTFQLQISGTVSDANGPLPGATVLEKGTTNGTQTDFDGNYTLEVSSPNAVLVFSYIGYAPQEVAIGNQGTINITLQEDASQLDEVVVLGYTTKKKGEVTGSVSTIDSKAIEQTANKDVAKSLAGRASGLIISDRGGVPGATNGNAANTEDDATTILIRGKSTLNNNSPLILIDGVQAASFSFLSPQDIASLTVLKDGAAAIYGSRAANGVILITTKRGQSGKPKINFTSSYTLSSFTRVPNLMSSEQYAIYENEVAERNGLELPFSQEDITAYRSGNDPIRFPNTDWADLTFANTSPETRNTLSISGGGEKVKYFVSGDVLSQEGIFRSGALKFKQNQVRSNIDADLTDDITLSVDLLGRFGNRDAPGEGNGFIYKHIFENPPTEVGIYPNGLPGFGGENGANPVIMSSNESGFVDQRDTDLRGRFALNIDLGKVLDGLSFNGFLGLRKIQNDTKNWYTPWTYYVFQEPDEYIPQQGFSQQGNQRILTESFFKYDESLINATLRYNKVFGEDHSFSTFVGLEKLDSDTRQFSAQRRGFPSDDRPELVFGSDEGQISTGVRSEFARMDFFGQFSYDFQKKYFLDFTIRHDGSSNFGPGKRYGTFPSVGVSWALDREKFLEDSEWLTALRLRSSWAKMGNDRIAPFQFLTRFNFGSSNLNTPRPNYYAFGDTGVILNGFASATVPNPDVTWETANMFNVGLNFGIFGGKLTGDINYFYQKREDILAQRAAAIPDFVGLQLPDENFGEVKNWGLEFELAWNDRIGEDFQYNLGMNFTQAKNEVIFLAEAEDVSDELRQEGNPIDSYIVYPTNGIFRDQAQVDSAPAVIEGTVEGEPFYIDTNGDGVIDANDRIRRGTSNIPEIQYGILGGFSYRNWSFNFLFQGQAEAETLVFFDQNGGKPDFVFNQRWTPENRNSRYPRGFRLNDPFSGNQSGNADNFEGADFWLHDASFLRLKEVELGYTIPADVLKLGDLRLFLRGYNLATFFSEIWDLGLDPEATGYNNFRNATYTPLKTYTFGLNFSF